MDKADLFFFRHRAKAEMGFLAGCLRALILCLCIHGRTIARCRQGRYFPCRISEDFLSMPELPEVETVRRGLAPAMEGRVIRHVTQRRPDLRFPLPERFAERLTGRRIRHLGRRAKYILVHLEPEAA